MDTSQITFPPQIILEVKEVSVQTKIVCHNLFSLHSSSTDSDTHILVTSYTH